MAGEQNLDKLISGMRPELNSGQYTFVTTNRPDLLSREDTVAEFKEQEGTTLIITTDKARELGFDYDFIASWITLKIHSSLHAVGLSAAISTALAKEDISCNIVAGFYHDHIFVDVSNTDNAMDVLHKLSKQA